MARLARRNPSIVQLSSTPDIMGGRLCVENTRVTADVVLANINAGLPPIQAYSHNPSLPTGSHMRAWPLDRDNLP